MKPINFTSVHDYLDLLFEGQTPTKEEIIQAKRIYWRAYNTDLKKRQRKQWSFFTIRLTKDEIAIIKERLANKQGVSDYIYKLVKRHLEKNTQVRPDVNTALIEQQLFLIAEYLRELLDYDTIDMQKIYDLEEYIQTLETLIQDLLCS